MKIQNVAVAGPNGNVGAAAIRHLVKEGFDVTALTRNPEKTASSFPDIKVVETDYGSVEGLTSTLKSCGQLDAVVCLIWRREIQSQLNLIDATIAAGIPHYIPSSFGADMTLPFNRDSPALVEKKAMEDHLAAKAKEGSITFTGINIGIFLDWALGANVIVNLKGDDPVRIYDGGDVEISATVRDDAGKAIAAALRKRDELVDRFCYIHSAKVTQNQLLGYAKALQPEKNFEVVNLNSEDLEKASREALENGDTSVRTMGGFLLRGVFSGINTFQKTDNEILGIKEWNEEQLKALVAQVIG